MRIAFAGGGRLGTHILNALIDSRHEVVALVQNGRQTKGWRRRVYPLIGRFTALHVSVTGIAVRHGIPIYWLDKMTEEDLDPLRKFDIDLLIVAGFGIILKKPLLELPRIGCLNCHSSLLPRNRGPNPFAGTILAGDTETGISFHIMEEGIDTGAIVRQFAIPVEPDDNAATLYINTSRLAGEEIVATVDQIEQEGLAGTPQDESQATYLPKITIEESFIDWTDSAVHIERCVRAGYPFQMARLRWKGRTIYLARSSVVDVETDAAPGTVAPGTVLQTMPKLQIATGDGVLQIDFAYILKPIVFTWPGLIGHVRVGDVLDPVQPKEDAP